MAAEKIYEKIKKVLSEEKIKLIELQRSRGYSVRKSIGLDKVLITCNKDNIGSKKTILNSIVLFV